MKTDIEAELRALGLSKALVAALLKRSVPDPGSLPVRGPGDGPELEAREKASVDGEPIPFGPNDQYNNCVALAFSQYLRDLEALGQEEAWARFEANKGACDVDYGVLP